MPKFRLDSSDGVTILGKPGSPDSLDVKPGETVEVLGQVDPKDAPDDAVIVVTDGQRAAWPTAIWSLVEDKPAKAAPVKEN